MRVFWIGALCAFTGFGLGMATANKSMVVVPHGDAKLVPIDSARPSGARMSVLWGDPNTGPSAMLLELKKGSGVMHVHASDYHLVTLEGTMKHFGPETSEADALPLAPGSYWFQPGEQGHADSCLTDTCLMFVKWEGKRDGRLAGPKP